MVLFSGFFTGVMTVIKAAMRDSGVGVEKDGCVGKAPGTPASSVLRRPPLLLHALIVSHGIH